MKIVRINMTALEQIHIEQGETKEIEVTMGSNLEREEDGWNIRIVDHNIEALTILRGSKEN